MDEEPRGEVVSLLTARTHAYKPHVQLPSEPERTPTPSALPVFTLMGAIMVGSAVLGFFVTIPPSAVCIVTAVAIGLGLVWQFYSEFKAAQTVDTVKATQFEGLWAVQAPENRYVIVEAPLFAYGINMLDVVVAHAEDKGFAPVILSVDEPSGYRTLRVFFDGDTALDHVAARVESMTSPGVEWREGDTHFYAVSASPDADFLSLIHALSTRQESGQLVFETCEERHPDRFGI